MKSKKHLMTAIAALAVLGMGAQAQARIGNYSHGYTYLPGNSAGNSDYAASYSLTSQQSSVQGSHTEFYRTSSAKEYLTMDTKLFGTSKNMLYALANASSTQRVSAANKSETPRYLKGAYAELRLMGNVVVQGSITNQSNCAEGSYTACLSGAYTKSQKFYEAEKRFVVGYIPVKVSTKVTGTLTLSLSARAGAKRLNSKSDAPETFRGDAEAKLQGGGYITTKNEGFAGLDEVLGVGVGTDFRLIDLNIGPTATASQSADTASTTLRFRNTITTDLRTMGGRLYAWVQIPLKKFERTLVSWSGLVLTDEELGGANGSLTVK